uniref:Uncharacterized protein LOC105040794 n=1 Tax=Elaeis guineensis var. tenera TaxID=51953 RepID=A0A8N4I7E9_ELAGV|nr:uncharacterized protein LOC105040794 [Elaeis guineensis]
MLLYVVNVAVFAQTTISSWKPLLLDALLVQEVLDELDHSGMLLNVISKAVEFQLVDVVSKVLQGNKWLRKATGIQPKHTCIKGIDEDILAKFQIAIAPSALAFTKSAALFSKAAMSTSDVAILEDAANDQLDVHAVLQDQV